MSHLYTFESHQKVQFYDCDPMGVVWHGNYLKYLEVARGEFLDFIGYGYRRIRDDGNFFPIVDERMKYLHSLRLGDEFTVVVYLDEYVNRLVHSFEIIRDGEICVKAKTVQVCLPVSGSELSFFMPQGFVNAVEALPGVSEKAGA
ncbi:MAG: acyl-CoA thioesterase [Ruminobacter sp.]|uniref:Acyl-CoA thioester hydrolase n=1 Tax=Ruminobacter amylophilus TaxID=867 RepID=A0A662ZES1_9GAMM|nr:MULTISPECIES: thioesterase family protein [Ruminobacter]MBQ3775764.1 acyl-CoA thioesterase [Ruminobacter sp.]SFP04955.1 acyl-CoA thioester hydrolase [Ruminobacter amylophilus]